MQEGNPLLLPATWVPLPGCLGMLRAASRDLHPSMERLPWPPLHHNQRTWLRPPGDIGQHPRLGQGREALICMGAVALPYLRLPSSDWRQGPHEGAGTGILLARTRLAPPVSKEVRALMRPCCHCSSSSAESSRGKLLKERQAVSPVAGFSGCLAGLLVLPSDRIRVSLSRLSMESVALPLVTHTHPSQSCDDFAIISSE